VINVTHRKFLEKHTAGSLGVKMVHGENKKIFLRTKIIKG